MSDVPASCPVSSYNEWDPLEEVIVGVLEGACISPWHPMMAATFHEDTAEELASFHKQMGGRPKSTSQHREALAELNAFVHVLEAEGVRVRRPEALDHARPFRTWDWESNGGYHQANPRDVLLVVGSEIIEAPMGQRCRFFEFQAYRSLVQEYFRRGAKWTSAPKARMADELYDTERWQRAPYNYVLTEAEPVWDAADIMRCGRDLFYQRSQVSNAFGAEWLQRHLGSDYRVHLIEFQDDDPVHLDTTFVPLCPGKLLVNPDRPIRALPEIIKRSGWDILTPPRSTLPLDYPGYNAYAWYHLNVLMLDERRVIVEKSEQPFIKALKDWGFTPIPVSFKQPQSYSGSFHCFTSDIRRRGTLQSYF
jgi:glycine amidinotransferase